MRLGALKLLALSGVLAFPAGAKIVSATLEFQADDTLRILLNGRELAGHGPNYWYRYGCLSSSDRTLPLDALNWNKPNLLALENADTKAGGMEASFLLTVKFSNRAPFYLWGSKDSTRMLHLQPGAKAPEGWEQAGFDDSSWSRPREVPFKRSGGPPMPPVALPMPGGGGSPIPHLSFAVNPVGKPGMRSLYRALFEIGHKVEKPRVLAQAGKAAPGKNFAWRLDSGADAAQIGAFKLQQTLPQGMALPDRSARISWNSPQPQKAAAQVRLRAGKVAQAQGWVSPENVLRTDIPSYDELQPALKKRATFTKGKPGWFHLEAPPADFAKAFPVIDGVIFRGLASLEGGAGNSGANVDLHLNYSLQEGLEPALAQDAQAMRSSLGIFMSDLYYDASQDRSWTWADLSRLKLKLETKSRGRDQACHLYALSIIVRCHDPAAYAPVFKAVVSAPSGSTLSLRASLEGENFEKAESDPVSVSVGP